MRHRRVHKPNCLASLRGRVRVHFSRQAGCRCSGRYGSTLVDLNRSFVNEWVVDVLLRVTAGSRHELPRASPATELAGPQPMAAADRSSNQSRPETVAITLNSASPPRSLHDSEL